MKKYRGRVIFDIDKLELTIKRQRERSKLYWKTYIRKDKIKNK